jgi:hypothetical protein
MVRQTCYQLPFPQPLPDKAIHHDPRLIKGMDAGAGSTDPSIVDRINTGVDGTADNTKHRQLSPTPNPRRPCCGRRVQPRWCAANFARYVDTEGGRQILNRG